MSFSLSLISDQSNIQMLLNYRTKRTKPPNVLMNDREENFLPRNVFVTL